MAATVQYDGTADDAFQKIQNYMKKNDPLGGTGAARITWDDEKLKAYVKGTGFEADITVGSSGGGTHVVFTFRPSFLLKPMTGKIEAMVAGHIKKALGDNVS